MVLTLLLSLILSSVASAELYIPLQIIGPVVGTDYTDVTAKPTNEYRYFKAYPELLYEVQISVLGGVFPFVYTLDTGPSGMTIDSVTGVLSWTTPLTAGSPHTIDVSVVDSASASDSVTWALAVNTDEFIFMDAVGGTSRAGGGTGTKANPFKTMADWYCADGSCDSSDHLDNTYVGYSLYWRTGTYHTLNIPIFEANATNHYVIYTCTKKPIIWLTYPGDTPVVNVTGGFFNAFGTCDNFYVDGIEFHTMTFRSAINVDSGGVNAVFRKNYFHGRCSSCGGSGTNAAPIFFNASGGVGFNQTVVDNHFEDILDTGYHSVLTYSSEGMVIERNVMDGTSEIGQIGIGIKQDNQNISIRNNRLDLPNCKQGIWVSSGSKPIQEQHNIEISFNLIKCDEGPAIKWGGTDIFFSNFLSRRNTWMAPNRSGGVLMRNLEPGRGPLRHTDDVHINDGGFDNVKATNGIYPTHCIDANTITCPIYPPEIIATNVLSTQVHGSNIVDSSGNLAGSFRDTYLGTRGYEQGGTVFSTHVLAWQPFLRSILPIHKDGPLAAWLY